MHILHAWKSVKLMSWAAPDRPDGAAPSSPAAPDSQTLGSSAASVCAVSPQLCVTRPSAARPEALRIWWLYPAAVRCTESPPAPGFAVTHTHTFLFQIKLLVRFTVKRKFIAKILLEAHENRSANWCLLFKNELVHVKFRKTD